MEECRDFYYSDSVLSLLEKESRVSSNMGVSLAIFCVFLNLYLWSVPLVVATKESLFFQISSGVNRSFRLFLRFSQCICAVWTGFGWFSVTSLITFPWFNTDLFAIVLESWHFCSTCFHIVNKYSFKSKSNGTYLSVLQCMISIGWNSVTQWIEWLYPTMAWFILSVRDVSFSCIRKRRCAKRVDCNLLTELCRFCHIVQMNFVGFSKIFY